MAKQEKSGGIKFSNTPVVEINNQQEGVMETPLPKTDNRKLKTWTTGSVGAMTSDIDAMEVHYLSERCLITQGANNFMLMK